MEKKSPGRVKAFALWEKTDKNGDRYLAGSFGDLKVFVWPNKYKEKESHPDWRVEFQEREREQAPPKTTDDDEIPF
jgi:hypothetical protein